VTALRSSESDLSDVAELGVHLISISKRDDILASRFDLDPVQFLAS